MDLVLVEGLRSICGPNRNDGENIIIISFITCSLINIIIVINSSCVGHVELMRKVRNACRTLIRKSERRTSLGRRICRLKSRRNGAT